MKNVELKMEYVLLLILIVLLFIMPFFRDILDGIGTNLILKKSRKKDNTHLIELRENIIKEIRKSNKSL